MPEIPEWLLRGLVVALVVAIFFAFGRRVRRTASSSLRFGRNDIVVDFETKPRSLSNMGLWVLVSNVSGMSIFIQRMVFVAEEIGRKGKPVTKDIGVTLEDGDDERIECHEEVFRAFEQARYGGDIYVGEIDAVVHIRRGRLQLRKRAACHLASLRHGVNDVQDAPPWHKRVMNRWRTKYFFWRLRH